jgi:dTDP-glucose 4,6-dehydratase
MDTILVTGGAGFIGSNFVHHWLAQESTRVVNLDKLTYAGNPNNLSALDDDRRHVFVKGDIGNRKLVSKLLADYQPRTVVNFAAESHVDRSIHGPSEFIQTNVVGTLNLLQEVRSYYERLVPDHQKEFRFLHVSTDEVYGSLGPDERAFSESTPYAPNSPYSASKAASDHLIRAFHHTYGLPTLTTNCSNNYGAYQFPEKLIPLVILNALKGKPLPVYGDGLNVRDWLYVDDHCEAIRVVLKRGRIGETYNIGGNSERTNIDVVRTICGILDELHPAPRPTSHASRITFVKDRPGHDRRYAIDASKIRRELDWQPRETFETGIRKTVQWYLDQMDWVEQVTSGEYQKWIAKQYGEA